MCANKFHSSYVLDIYFNLIIYKKSFVYCNCPARNWTVISCRWDCIKICLGFVAYCAMICAQFSVRRKKNNLSTDGAFQYLYVLFCHVGTSVVCVLSDD